MRYVPADRIIRFKGTDTTFVDFPARLQHVLSESIDNVVVECTIFPAYETKGELVSLVHYIDSTLIKNRRKPS